MLQRPDGELHANHNPSHTHSDGHGYTHANCDSHSDGHTYTHANGDSHSDSPPKIVGMAFVGLQQVWGVNRGVDRALRGVSERIGNG